MAGVPTSLADPNAGIKDLVRSVIENFRKNKVAQTALLTNHTFIRRLMGAAARKHTGGMMRSDIRFRDKQGAKFVNLMEGRGANRDDNLLKLTSEPKHSDDAFMFDIREEAFLKGDGTLVQDHLEQQWNGMRVSMFDLWEGVLVGMPINAAAVEVPFGVTAFLRPLAANEESPDGSFNGIYAVYGDGTTTSNIGGQDASATANARLRSRAATDDGDFHEGTIATITKQKLATNFNFVPGLKNTDGSKSGGNWAALSTARFAAAQGYADKVITGGPDSLIAAEHNELIVRGTVLAHAPILDSYAWDPIIAMAGDVIYGYQLQGFWMKTLGPGQYGNSLTQMQVGIASSGAVHCTNPRGAGWVIHRKRT